MLTSLRRLDLLSARAAWALLCAIKRSGVNLMALLQVTARLHPERLAVADEMEQLSYRELLGQSEALAAALHARFGMGRGQRVGLVCGNHAAAVKALFACSRLGVNLVLASPEQSPGQILALAQQLRLDFCIHDESLAAAFQSPEFRAWAGRALPAHHASLLSVTALAVAEGPHGAFEPRPPRGHGGRIAVLTAGTTGQAKLAQRRPSLLAFLPPFLALLEGAQLDACRSVFVATPLHHGFGLATVIMAVAMGAEIHLAGRFDAARACALIASRRLEVVTLVPLMLQRLLAHDAQALTPLQRVLCGGAPLNAALAEQTRRQLGPVLFNLYGSSEAGFSIMATPAQLERNPGSIGRPIRGVQMRLVGPQGVLTEAGKVGRIELRCAWSVRRGDWIDTGDLALRDSEGNVTLCGRADDMIISGGENVYPLELEQLLLQHPDVLDVAAIGIPDAEFGQRLKALVVHRHGLSADSAQLLAWLRPRASRHQMPKAIEFRAELPHSELGKLKRRELSAPPAA
jgi:fatty-acyl-CoA synthase